jgi:hypothetical protein
MKFLVNDTAIQDGEHSFYTLLVRCQLRQCDRSEEDAYSSWALDPVFAFVGGPFYHTLDFVIAFWTMVSLNTLLTSLFCIISNF